MHFLQTYRLILFCPLSLILLTAISDASALLAKEAKSVALIFDTDFGNDVDDVLALGVIHALERRGKCRLLAVTVTKDHEYAAPFVDVVNTFYGRGEVPIGVCRSGVTPAEGKYNGLCTKKDDGKLRYPHNILSGYDAPDAVKVLRSALVSAEDGSVVLVQVGFSTNLANLLKSKPDKISPLSGIELLKKKAKLLSIMAGAFTKIAAKDGNLHVHKEYNVVKDIPSAQSIAHEWPTPIVWSGYEIGIALPYPHESIEQDYQYVKHHPLADAYYLYSPPPHNRPTWDLTSVLYAVFPNRGYFDLSQPGHVIVTDDGVTNYKESSEGKQQYLKISDSQKVRITEALVQLSSQPPSK